MPPTQEQRRIAAARAGEERAFAGIVDQHAKSVYNLCYRMLGDPVEAEDAAQEAFLKAYLKLHRYDPDRPFGTWLLSIAAHHCIDLLRRRRIRWLSLEAVRRRPAGRESQPESAADRADQTAQLQAELAKLGATERAAVILHYWYELSYREIGQALGLSVGAVKSRLHRARRELARSPGLGGPAGGKGRPGITHA